MKIIFFLEYYFPNIGGVETLFKGLVDNLSETNNTITVITARPYPDSPIHIKEILFIQLPIMLQYLHSL